MQSHNEFNVIRTILYYTYPKIELLFIISLDFPIIYINFFNQLIESNCLNPLLIYWHQWLILRQFLKRIYVEVYSSTYDLRIIQVVKLSSRSFSHWIVGGITFKHPLVAMQIRALQNATRDFLLCQVSALSVKILIRVTNATCVYINSLNVR